MAKWILILLTFTFVNAFADHHSPKTPNQKRRIAQGAKSGKLSKEEIKALKDEKKAERFKDKDVKTDVALPKEDTKIDHNKTIKREKKERKDEKPQVDQTGSTADQIKKTDSELEKDPLEEEQD